MRKNNRKGFTLVELLAVMVIIGILAVIGIAATSTLIDRAKNNKTDSQKNTIILSAQTYLQNNKHLVPKVIGESTIIKVQVLRDAKYLTQDITNTKGESCLRNSYVKVYKLSNTEYTYTTYLYCGDEEVPENETVPEPSIEAKFTDSTGETTVDILNNVSDAYLHIEIVAANEADILEYKNQGTDIVIDGYSFKIFTYNEGKKIEVYNSGSLSGGREEKLIINKKLNDYIDVTTETALSLEVVAINTVGGVSTITETIGETGSGGTSEYDDTVKPMCVKPSTPYAENDWLNKKEYNTTKVRRKLTIGCNDGRGSGCIRNYFTNSWPNDTDTKGAEYVIMEVKDNAGNVSVNDNDCRFRVNVDIETPSATVTAHVGKNSTSNASTTLASKYNQTNILNKTIQVSDSSTSIEIEPTTDFYKNLVGEKTNDKWMNNTNYPYGVVYKIVLKDNIRLDKWTWKTNAGYINSMTDENYLKVNDSNPEATSGETPQDASHGQTNLHGSTDDTVYVRFLTEGMRYGVFTAYDKAGNSIKIKIAAHLDRTAPPVPSNVVAYLYNKVRTGGTSPSSTLYGFGTWTNRYVRVQTVAGQNRDNLTNNVTLSGFWQFYYDAKNNANKSVGTKPYNTNSSGIGIYDFKGAASAVDGKNKIRFKGCDKANNCSEWAAYSDVWIDITVPECKVTKTITSGAESSYGWLGIGETARVTATCKDPTSTLASGCTEASFYHDYNYQINTTTAGAKGNGKAGSFVDAAGNSVDCTATERIQIDYAEPKCKTTGGSASWTNKSRTVTGTCSDTGGSGCVSNISHTYNYNIATNTAGPEGNNKPGRVYDKADNSEQCSADKLVYVDKTNPYVVVNKEPQAFESNDPVTVIISCRDDFSGLSTKYEESYSIEIPAPTNQIVNIGKCCEDNAGNEICDSRGPYGVKIYGRHPDCGVEEYKTCRTSGCGVELYKRCSSCGCESLSNWSTSYATYYVGDCGQCTYKSNPCRASSDTYKIVTCDIVGGAISGERGYAVVRQTTQTRSCLSYKRCSSCDVEKYYLCEHEQCGVKLYNACWHY